MHGFIHMKSFSNHINFTALSRSWCNKCYKWQINLKIYNTSTYVIWVVFASFCQICRDARIFKSNLWLVGSRTASQSDVMLGNPCYLTWISTWSFLELQASESPSYWKACDALHYYDVVGEYDIIRKKKYVCPLLEHMRSFKMAKKIMQNLEAQQGLIWSVLDLLLLIWINFNPCMDE